MSLRNCSECGRIFEFTARDLCPDCVNKEEEDYELIKNCLRHNPGAGISEVSEKTGVAEKKILVFLKKGRLLLGPENSITLNCERCGKPIRSGRYCDGCCTLMDKIILESASETTGSNQSRNRDERSRFTKYFQK
ncbi:MAG: MerR family transcriptional regulator [Thermacetogeniaceae bacterium]